jgi:sigma-B regulation protein RsbU (phosphoserine phosphatase)
MNITQLPNNSVIYSSRILVVDDTALNRELILTYLESEGYKNVDVAENGVEALSLMEGNVPDLVISDLVMPIMDGFELIRQMRKKEKFHHVPIIVQTSITNPSEKQEAWNSGATDILSKPIYKVELVSRVRVQLNTIHLIHQLENYYHIAQQDVRQALNVQKSLVPDKEDLQRIYDRYKVRIEAIFEPSRFLSGDLWGVIEIDDNQLGIWISDFAGKGIQAALNTFRIHTIIQEYRATADTPTEFMDILNRRLHKMVMIGQFATFFMGVIDVQKAAVRYVAASSPDPIVYDPKSKNFEIIDGTGVPLGVIPDACFPVKEIQIPQGNSLILYSDLLWEPRALPGVCFLPEYLPSFFNELKGDSLVHTVQEYLDLLEEIHLADDLTLIEIKINP